MPMRPVAVNRSAAALHRDVGAHRGDSPVRIALVGRPGSGKGTHGAALARHLGIPLISSGALLRAGAAAIPAEWRDIKAALDREELVRDDDVLALIADA